MRANCSKKRIAQLLFRHSALLSAKCGRYDYQHPLKEQFTKQCAGSLAAGPPTNDAHSATSDPSGFRTDKGRTSEKQSTERATKGRNA